MSRQFGGPLPVLPLLVLLAAPLEAEDGAPRGVEFTLIAAGRRRSRVRLRARAVAAGWQRIAAELLLTS